MESEKVLHKLMTLIVSVSFLSTSLFGNYNQVFAKNETNQVLNRATLQNKLQDHDFKQPVIQTVIDNVYKGNGEKQTEKKVDQKERKEILVKYKDEFIAENIKAGQ